MTYISTTVLVSLTVTSGNATRQFIKNVSSTRSEITFRAQASVMESRETHTMQVIPSGWEQVSCVDNASFVDIPHLISSLNSTGARVNYRLQVLQTASSQPVRVTVQTSHASCLFLDTNSTTHAWSPGGCSVSPTSSLGTVRCRCSHMTPFGGDISVTPNTVEYREITADNITGNPIILILVVLLWMLIIGLIVRAKRMDTRRILNDLGPIELAQNSEDHQATYQITIRTGIRPGSGTSSRVFIQLFGSRGRSRDILLTHPWRPIFYRNFVDTFMLTTPFELGVIQKIVIRHDAHGLEPRWYLGRVEVTSINIEDSLRIFWFNNWLALDIGDGTFSCGCYCGIASQRFFLPFQVSFTSQGHLSCLRLYHKMRGCPQ